MTRKLSNGLVLNPHIASAPAALSIPPFTRSKELPTPRTKKSRRTGRVFISTSMPTNFAEYNSSNTSLSSFDSEGEDGEAEKGGCVFVRRGGAIGYHYHHHLDISLPVNHRNDVIKVTLVPSPSDRKLKKGGKSLPPPLLLRLRALPVNNQCDSLATTSFIPFAQELGLPAQPRTPSPELLKKVEEKPQGPRLTPGERKARREGKKRAIGC